MLPLTQPGAPMGVTMALVAVLVESHLRTLPRRRALKFVQTVTDLFEEPVPLGMPREEVRARDAARELWMSALPRIMRLLR